MSLPCSSVVACMRADFRTRCQIQSFSAPNIYSIKTLLSVTGVACSSHQKLHLDALCRIASVDCTKFSERVHACVQKLHAELKAAQDLPARQIACVSHAAALHEALTEVQALNKLDFGSQPLDHVGPLQQSLAVARTAQVGSDGSLDQSSCFSICVVAGSAPEGIQNTCLPLGSLLHNETSAPTLSDAPRCMSAPFCLRQISMESVSEPWS